jgi:hypothetical protein
MQMSFLLKRRLFSSALSLVVMVYLAISHSARGQTAVSERVVVSADEVGSAYGAPPGFSRAKFSNLISAYVLPPWAVYSGIIYQGDAIRFNRPDHQFTQEIEIGLPYRFGVAIENTIEAFRGRTQERTFSIEGRYALADWNKIPLNPTLFVEYKFGLGTILHDEGPPAPLEPGEAEAFINENRPLPDAYEVRLLLSQDFFEKIEWALNGFFEQEIGGDRGREYGFAQSLMMPIFATKSEVTGRADGKGVAPSRMVRDERLKVGVEMQFTTFTDVGIRDNPSYRFVIGPTFAWKPTRNTRLDISPLFGTTDDSPRASIFVVFSMLFGPPGAHETEQGEAPASMRNR